MDDNGAKQAAMGCIDPKGNIVLKQFDDVAVLFRPQNSHEPYVVANGYDKQTGEWGHGSYFSDLGHAWEKANPEIVEDACIRWQRDDIKAALESKGCPATEANVSWMGNSRIMEDFRKELTDEGDKLLDRLVQGEKRYLDAAEKDAASKDDGQIGLSDIIDTVQQAADAKRDEHAQDSRWLRGSTAI